MKKTYPTLLENSDESVDPSVSLNALQHNNIHGNNYQNKSAMRYARTRHGDNNHRNLDRESEFFVVGYESDYDSEMGFSLLCKTPVGKSFLCAIESPDVNSDNIFQCIGKKAVLRYKKILDDGIPVAPVLLKFLCH